MGQAAIRTEIAAIIRAIPGVGIVHEYERFSLDWSKFLEQFKNENVILGWMVTRKTTELSVESLGEIEKHHIFSVVGIHGLRDAEASEHVIQGLADQVQDAFGDNDDLNGTCDTTMPEWGDMKGVMGLQIVKVENRLFGSVLCHVAECFLCACETVDI